MVALLPWMCPHCRRETMFSTLGSEAGIRPKGQRVVALICLACEDPIVIVAAAGAFDEWFKGRQTGAIPLVGVWPKALPVEAPEYLPVPLPTLFVEASDCLARRQPNSAAPVLRRIVELAAKHLAPAIVKDRASLAQRIEALAGASLITAAMRDWAHEVRLIANENLHEDVLIDQVDAEALKDFVEMFLVYAFTLPERVRLRRAARAAPPQPT